MMQDLISRQAAIEALQGMTKAEAIAMLKRIQEPEAWEPQINQAAFDALDMAIKALTDAEEYAKKYKMPNYHGGYRW